MNPSKEVLDYVVRLLVLFFLSFFPIRWHSMILPTSTLCYVKKQLPLTTSGDLDLISLNQMNWGMLPIESLWPRILNDTAVNDMLLDHCGELEYNQIYWIGEFDPVNRVSLLTNEQCMKQINWANLELDEYINHLPELEIQNISDLNDLSEELIIYGLEKVNFSFSSLRAHCDFIERLPVSLLSRSQVLKNPTALNLFNINCFLGASHLIKPFSDFLFKMQFSSFGLSWKYHLTELEDFSSTFPVNNGVILRNCQVARQNLARLTLNPTLPPTFELISALQTRNFDYIVSLEPQIFKTYFCLGPFDQYRIILIILGRRDLNIFIKYFEADIFENWVIHKIIQDEPEIADWLFTIEITSSPPLLRLLSLHPPEITVNIPPFQVQKASEIKNVEQLRESLRLLMGGGKFACPNFHIKFADEAVVDLGGPLLDWITRIIQLFLDFGIFSSPINFESQAQVFLDPELFKFLGLLHGKLVQIGSGPCWLPVIEDEIIQNVSSLLNIKNNPKEAIRLFNDFQFPNLNKPPKFSSSHKVTEITEISIYLVKLEKSFESWKILAWENYFTGLSHFFISKAPRQLIRNLLIPSESPTISGLLSLSKVEVNEAIPHDLNELWGNILESFSVSELLNLLLFITGQFRIVPISIFFHISNELRLPQARTCFRHLFLYCPQNLSSPSDLQALTEWLRNSLKTSISNYEGFALFSPSPWLGLAFMLTLLQFFKGGRRQYFFRPLFNRQFSTPTQPTGIIRRYEQFQQEFPKHLVLMQVGDFYEIYGDAVEQAARILDIAVTRSPSKQATTIQATAMTGFPVRSFDTFISKLIRAGVSVVVADQIVLSDSNRFDRKVTRVITPGTIVEENLLDRNCNNFLLFLDASKFSCAWMDVSTGDFFTATCTGSFTGSELNESKLLSLLSRLNPREVLIESPIINSQITKLLKRSSALVREVSMERSASSLLSEEGFTKLELEIAGKLLHYVRETMRTNFALKPLKRFASARHFMSIDADSFRSLDILSSSSNNSNSTLFNTLNECKTALGSRLLSRRLQAPFLDADEIDAALDRVDSFYKLGRIELEILQRKLNDVGDIERILQRLCLRRPQGVSRDLRALGRSLLAASEAFDWLASKKITEGQGQLLSTELKGRVETISRAFNEKLPLRDSEGDLFCPDFDAELDDLRKLRDNSVAVFDEMASSYRHLTGIPNLRISVIKGDQHIIEVPKSIKLPPDVFSLLMQTETKARYTTENLLTKSFLLRSISDRVTEKEIKLLSSLLEPILSLSQEIRLAADKVAQVDLESSFGLLALKQSYTRPKVLKNNNSQILQIIDGRHPVLDKLFTCLEDENSTLRHFTPNSLNSTEPNKFLLLTGPNMGGKSTFLRQNALIILMAQSGSFVPASTCSFSPIDAIFTRIGASDDLSRDKSTFMVEMSETAHILQHATPQSLVLIDEIGRGTSPAEGLALAASIANHLINYNRAHVLFATHYHEIASSPLLSDFSIQMACTQAQVHEEGSVVLVPKIKAGLATHSYALPVASLAGIPSSVIKNAAKLLIK